MPIRLRVASGDCVVEDLFHLARRRIVVQCLLYDVGVCVLDLLESEAEGRGTDDGTIELISVALDLAPAIATTF